MINGNMSLLILGLAALFNVPASIAQQPATFPPPEKSADERIAELEARVETLENLLFASVQLSVYDARRRLEVANHEREQNQRLFYHGLLASIELERSIYKVDRARCELELAQATSGHRIWSSRIEVLEAEFELKYALDALERSRLNAGRGLVTEFQLKQNTESVERAEKALEFAKQKLEVLESKASDNDRPADTDEKSDQ